MELPVRSHSDRFTTPGRYRELETHIRSHIGGSNTPILFIYAFDPRTRLGPFVFVDKTLIPGAPRAVGSALFAAGFQECSSGAATVEPQYPAQYSTSRRQASGGPHGLRHANPQRAGLPVDPRRLATRR